jgi:hypothetical protein
MKRLLPVTIAAAVILLAAAHSVAAASTPKEPTGVFSYAILEKGTLNVQLYDVAKKKVLKSGQFETNLPVQGDYSVDQNRAVQYDAAGGSIVFTVENVSEYDGSKPRADLDFCSALYRTDFKGKTLKSVYATKECVLGNWILHSTKPLLYAALNEQAGLRIVEVDLKTGKNRFITESALDVRNKELRVGADGKTLLFIATPLAPHANPETTGDLLVTIDLKTGKADRQPLNVPRTNPGQAFSPSVATDNLSPDRKTIAYHLGTVGVKTGVRTAMKLSGHYVANYYTYWSGDGRRVVLMLHADDETTMTPARIVVYDVSKGTASEQKGIKGAFVRAWAPSSRYLLFKERTPEIVKLHDVKTGTSRAIYTPPADAYSVETQWVRLP